jgi:hypothetical protein
LVGISVERLCVGEKDCISGWLKKRQDEDKNKNNKAGYLMVFWGR